MKNILRNYSFALLLVFVAFSASAVDRYYTMMNGDFFAGGMWSLTAHGGPACGCNPDADGACDIVIPPNVIVYIGHIVTTSCNIVIGNNATIIIENGGGLVVAGNGGITGTGNFQVNAGGTVDVSGNFSISGTGNAIVNGTMNVGGTLNFGGSGNLCGGGNVNVGAGITGGAPCGTIVLPIELLSFEAVSVGDKVQVKWITASESINEYFTIERSSDGINFIEITRHDGAGNSSQIIEYAITDNNPLTGTSYYRLTQTNTNGSSETFSAVVVKRSAMTPSIDVYPNPGTPGEPIFLSFTGFGDEEVLVVVRDIQGREYYSKVILLKDGNLIIAFDPEKNIPAGTYFIVATSFDNVYSRKIIVR
jgi:hypothetical protein